jgi:hypothetical protein
VQSFRTSPGWYAVVCGVYSLPLPIWGWGALIGAVGLTPVLISASLPAVAAFWLAYFRLRIDDFGIEYRDLLRPGFKIAYSDIASLKTRTISYGRGFGYEWVLHLHDGRKLRLNLKPFPREAYRLLCERICCDA